VTVLVVTAAIAAMVATVLAGAVAPYRRAAAPALQPPADPLEDRRLALLVSMKDLQASRDTGAIDAEEYLRLRDDTETRMARVLRAIEERRRKEDESPGPGAPAHRPRRSPARYLAIAMVAVIALSVGLVPALMRSLNDRTDAQDLTASIGFFRDRVRANPHDVAARLDYAHRLQDTGQLGDAFRQYTAALAIQPDNVDALSNYGLLLHLSGRPLEGLAAENRALKIQPEYPEALFYKGAILFKGLDRPEDAIGLLRRYLDASPYGSYGPTARKMIGDAHDEIATGGSNPTPASSLKPSPPVPSPQLTVPTG
jgi:tetratricopeptide (TPR) repeat protein